MFRSSQALPNPRYWPTLLLIMGAGGMIDSAYAVQFRVLLSPIWLPGRMTVTDLFALFDTPPANARMGLYTDNGRSPLGGKLLGDTGSFSPTSALITGSLTPPVKLNAGLAWLAVVADDVTVLYNRASTVYPTSDVTGEHVLTGTHYDATSLAFTDPCPAVTTGSFDAIVGSVRVSSTA